MLSPSSIIKTNLINPYNIRQNKNLLLSKMDELEDLKKKCINLRTLNTQVKSCHHHHGVVLLYSNSDWSCDICGYFYQRNKSRYHCSLCEFNLCKNCNEKNIKYPLSSYNNQIPIKFQKYKFPNHEHNLLFSRSSRFEHSLNDWCCNLCRKLHNNRIWSYYCTLCDYDICSNCAKKFIN